MNPVTRFPRPTLVVSRCLCGGRCRWNGDTSPSGLVKELRHYARVIPVCPEMEIGLGVPRDRIVLVRRGNGVDLFQPSSSRRLAQKMRTFKRRFLAGCGEVDGFILKHKSPSCGLRSVKLYASTAPDAPFKRVGVGLFAAEAQRVATHSVFMDEERLADPEVRDSFLTRLFTLAAWRDARKRGSGSALGRFHSHHRLALQSFSSKAVIALDTLIAGPDRSGAVGADKAERYERLLHEALQKRPRCRSTVRLIEPALEHYSPFLEASEVRRFRRLIRDVADGIRPLHEARKMVQVWAVRYDKSFIRSHSFYRPYPGPLAEA